MVLLAYLALAFVTLADQGFYTYNFLDHDAVGGRGYVAAYVAAIAVAVVVVFGLVWGLVWLRRWLTEDRLGLTGKFAAPRRRRRHAEGDDAAVVLTAMLPKERERARREDEGNEPEVL